MRLFFGTLFFTVVQSAFAWDDFSSLSAIPQPPPHLDYNTLLAEKISLSQLAFTDEQRGLWDAALNAPGSSPLTLRSEPATVGVTSLGTRYSAGWNVKLSQSVTTGPVAQYSADQASLNCPQCELSDRPSQEQVASVGWRVNSRMGWITPWAQLSYSHQLADENTRYQADESESGRQENWLDVSVGAHMPLNNNLAAFASFSQTDALNTGEKFIYSLGVSASF